MIYQNWIKGFFVQVGDRYLYAKPNLTVISGVKCGWGPWCGPIHLGKEEDMIIE